MNRMPFSEGGVISNVILSYENSVLTPRYRSNSRDRAKLKSLGPKTRIVELLYHSFRMLGLHLFRHSGSIKLDHAFLMVGSVLKGLRASFRVLRSGKKRE